LPQDLYRLSDRIFLEKVDYFSSYRLLKKVNDDYVLLDASITKINRISDTVICYSNSTKEYLVISKNDNVQRFDNLKNQYNIHEESLLSPWQFIEKYKQHDRLKTIREILLILIVLIVVLLLRELIVKLKS